MGVSELSEIDDIEAFTRRFMDKFEDHPKLERRNDVVQYGQMIEFINLKIDEFMTGSENNVQKTHLLSEGASSEYTYNVADTDAILAIRIPAIDQDELLSGHVNHDFSDTTIDNQQVAEEGTFLYRVRKTAQNISERNDTEYLFPSDLNDGPLTDQPSEQIYEIGIPVDYDEQILDETLNAIVKTTNQLQDVYKQALSVPSPEMVTK